jgi:hypothetical protein
MITRKIKMITIKMVSMKNMLLNISAKINNLRILPLIIKVHLNLGKESRFTDMILKIGAREICDRVAQLISWWFTMKKSTFSIGKVVKKNR